MSWHTVSDWAAAQGGWGGVALLAFDLSFFVLLVVVSVVSLWRWFDGSVLARFRPTFEEGRRKIGWRSWRAVEAAELSAMQGRGDPLWRPTPEKMPPL